MSTEIIEENIFIGKDILELLSSSMYVNPLTIYRVFAKHDGFLGSLRNFSK